MRTAGSYRSPLRRYLEVRGVVGRIHRPHLTTRLTTSDGVLLRASYLGGPAGVPGGGSAADDVDGAGATDHRLAVLVVHGFAANRRKPSYARLAEGLADHLPVLTVDLRGHGESGGGSTLGDREAMDIEAAVDWLGRFGHDRVVAVGASMGGTAVLHAACLGVPLSALVTVSAPARFRTPPQTRALAQLYAVWSSPTRRRLLRAGAGVTLDGPDAWRNPPPPEEMVTRITVPLLAVHGADDAYFPPQDADDLVRNAAGPAVGWQEPVGFGHAEDGFTPAFIDRIARAIAALANTGEFPDRDTSLIGS